MQPLLTVQALRGVAALLVVAYHVTNVWQPDAWPNGSAGVDLFFVISGLVMTLAAERAPSWRQFLWARVVRIVPLYWLATGAKVLLTLTIPALAMRTRHDPGYIVGSLLFWPMPNAAGELFPILPPGWTLSYEWLFYGLVAVALWRGHSVLYLTSFVLIGAVLMGVINPMALEFLFGVLIATGLRRLFLYAGDPGPKTTDLLGFCLVVSIIVLLTIPVDDATMRPLAWGLPAALVVAAAAASEWRLAPLLPRWALALGDASYSIYLTHLFVLPIALALVPRSLPVMLAAGLAASAGAGWLCYVLVERPLLRAMRRSGKADPAAGNPVSVLLPASRVLSK